jgi:hypothetical protein
MTKEEFKDWMYYMGYDNKAAAKALGVTHWTIKEYRMGRIKINETIRLLCGMLKEQSGEDVL